MKVSWISRLHLSSVGIIALFLYFIDFSIAVSIYHKHTPSATYIFDWAGSEGTYLPVYETEAELVMILENTNF